MQISSYDEPDQHQYESKHSLIIGSAHTSHRAGNATPQASGMKAETLAMINLPIRWYSCGIGLVEADVSPIGP